MSSSLMGRERDSLVERERVMKERLAKETEVSPNTVRAVTSHTNICPFCTPWARIYADPEFDVKASDAGERKLGIPVKPMDVAAKSALRTSYMEKYAGNKE